MSKMKMSDVFELPVTAYTSRIKLNIGFSVSCLNIECAHGRGCDGEKHAHSAAHAINNHDRMVEEIAELRSFAKKVSELDVETFHFETQGGDEGCLEYVCTDIVYDAVDMLAKLSKND